MRSLQKGTGSTQKLGAAELGSAEPQGSSTTLGGRPDKINGQAQQEEVRGTGTRALGNVGTKIKTLAEMPSQVVPDPAITTKDILGSADGDEFEEKARHVGALRMAKM